MNQQTGRALACARWHAGYSMSELIIVISIMGVLAGIAVGSFNQYLDGSKEAVAIERQEMLNQALHRFAQSNNELLYAKTEQTAGDELWVLQKLQYRNPDNDLARVGSPYMDPRYNPVPSSAVDQYRLRWTGSRYELLKPGKAGLGLLMNFAGSDFTQPRVFPPDFESAGR